MSPSSAALALGRWCWAFLWRAAPAGTGAARDFATRSKTTRPSCVPRQADKRPAWTPVRERSKATWVSAKVSAPRHGFLQARFESSRGLGGPVRRRHGRAGCGAGMAVGRPAGGLYPLESGGGRMGHAGQCAAIDCAVPDGPLSDRPFRTPASGVGRVGSATLRVVQLAGFCPDIAAGRSGRGIDVSGSDSSGARRRG